jgi:hypothetical protein
MIYEALHEMSLQNSGAAASPPDVRRGYASPFTSKLRMGCALGSGSAPRLWAKGRTRGQAQNLSEL